MTVSSKKNRIIFLDLMRAFAVLQMVQGHTVDVLLSDNFRNMDNPVFAFWLFMRGMTAPIFMFTAGTVFTYLFRLANEPFKKNPRVIKGIKRFLLLVFLGYMLRYPTPTLVVFKNISAEQWKTFFAVDVLQLIGFGVLFLVGLTYIAEKTGIKDYIVFSAGSLFFIALYLPFSHVHWLNYLPAPLAGYMYSGTGSNFPLFPWTGYVIAGGVLGSYLAGHPNVFKSAKFSLYLSLFGAAFLVLAVAGNEIETAITGANNFWSTSPNLILFRIGIVLVLNSIVSFISLKIETVPKILILIGRNTLLIYIVHLCILYGSAWNPGLIIPFSRSFNGWETVLSALVMISLMTYMVILINKYKIKNKQLVT